MIADRTNGQRADPHTGPQAHATASARTTDAAAAVTAAGTTARTSVEPPEAPVGFARRLARALRRDTRRLIGLDPSTAMVRQARAVALTARFTVAAAHRGVVAAPRTTLAQRRARQALLERYLLGRLDEGARAVLRATAIANPHVFAEVRETELDLLDALAGGTLDRDRARIVYATLTAWNRTTWPVSQALAERLRGAAQGARTSDNEGPRRQASILVPQFAVGAASRRAAESLSPSTPLAIGSIPRFALVDGVDSSWTSAERAHDVFRSRLRVWPAAAAVFLAASLWVARPATPPPLPSVAQASAPAAAAAAAAVASSGPTASMPAITLHLSADASHPPPQRVRLTAGASRLRIDAALPPDTASPLDVAIHDAAGRVRWSARRIAVAAGSTRVTLSIPAESLGTGLLSLIVTPSDGSQPARHVAFRIE